MTGSTRRKTSFRWGAATSAYQIEGTAPDDGRGPSIWDDFCRTPGRIEDGSSGVAACDHYTRWREDVALMRGLGLDAYRFSIAWPRVLPSGVGARNERGLDFYDRLVDGLLDAGIEPFATLYHWDLPSALQSEGGWANRDTVSAYVDFAALLARRLGDRVQHWITQNEPWCAAVLGHREGAHAPGDRDPARALTVAHHLMLSHGRAVARIRSEIKDARVGLSHMYVVCHPASPSRADQDAARRLDGEFNRWYLDPLYGRGYPEDVVEHHRRAGTLAPGALPFVKDGDLLEIAQPTDFLGLNYYTRAIARCENTPEQDNLPRELSPPPPSCTTDMGWEVYPAGLEEALRRVHLDYRPSAVFVTENGAAYATSPDEQGHVHDHARVEYLRSHIRAVLSARADGVPVGGYFAWSLLDNFEWAFGYTKRFGLVWVDFETGERTAKASAHWYRDKIAHERAAEGETGR